jgi:ABC-type Zn uptake system ZnuABC Zn-binding protein ZnuA
MVSASGTGAIQVVATSTITPLKWADEKQQEAIAEAEIMGEAAPEPVGDDGDDNGEFDPHVWHDVRNVIAEVAVIRDALIAASQANANIFTSNAASYSGQLEALDTWANNSVVSLPPEKRILFTSHDALGYLARAYGFTIVGSALGSLSTEAADPSAGDIARLIDAIKASGVPAIFAENVENTDLMNSIASDANVTLAPPLHTDALSKDDGDAATYEALMRTNVATIVAALGGTVAPQ